MKKISRNEKLKEEWLKEEEDYLISISNLLQEKFSDNPNFLKADSYLTNAIQQKFVEVAGYTDEPEYIIEVVASILGIKEDELLKDLGLS